MNWKGVSALGKPLTIGFISPYLDGHFFGKLLYHIHQITSERKIRLIALKTPKDDNSYDIPLAARHIDGWIVVKHPLNPKVWGQLQVFRKPVVGINHVHETYPSVLIDNRAGMRMSVEHLIKHGHREIAFVGNLTNISSAERYLGYLDALAAKRIPFDPDLVLKVDNYSYDGGHQLAEKIVETRFLCTAIASCSDLLLLVMFERLKHRGYKIPQDFAVIGFDDIPSAELSHPALTSIHLPVEDMAKASVNLLLKQIHSSAPLSAGTWIRIKPSLLVRGSCGCPHPHQNECRTDELLEDNEIRAQAISKLEGMMDVYLQFNRNVMDGNMEAVRNLSWLRSTHAVWGCLGQWDTADENNETLITSQHFTLYESLRSPIGHRSAAVEYPALHFLPESTLLDGKHIMTLHPIRSKQQEWGVLALVEPVDKTIMYYKSKSSPYGLIGTALEILERTESLC
jgi:DNA-binding LacI/PurR family transcriptional regulator